LKVKHFVGNLLFASHHSLSFKSMIDLILYWYFSTFKKRWYDFSHLYFSFYSWRILTLDEKIENGLQRAFQIDDEYEMLARSITNLH
jgi:hypothetical protein